jgi:iron(III) transport system permease protein
MPGQLATPTERHDVDHAPSDGPRQRRVLRLPRLRLTNALWFVIAGALAWMIIAPLWFVADSATRSETPLGLGPARSLSALRDVYTSSEYLGALLNALLLATVVTGLAVVLGTGMALAVARVKLPGARLIDTFLILPLFLSPFVGLVAWVSLASPKSGYIHLALEPIERLVGHQIFSFFNIWSFQGIVWVMTIFFAPWSYLFTIGTLRSMDSSLEEAAKASGASVGYMLRRITLPLALPSIFASALLIFVLAAEMYTIPGVIGGTTGFKALPWVIYNDARVFPLQQAHAAAAGTMLLWIAVGGVLLQRRFTRVSERFVTVSGKGFRSRPIEVGRWRYVILAVIIGYILTAVVLPMGALVVASLMKYTSTNFSRDLFTLDHYRRFFDSPALMQGLINSAVLAISAAAICVFLGYYLSHNEIRYPSWAKRTFATIATVPIAVPGLVLGLGFLIAFVRSPLYSTFMLLLIAHVVRLLPYGILTSRSAILSVDRSLEEAARVLGASRSLMMRRISLPLAKGALSSVFIFMMLLSIKELSASIFLSGTSNPLLSVEVWSSMQGGEYQLAATMSIIQTVMTLGIIAVARLFLRVGLRDMAR